MEETSKVKIDFLKSKAFRVIHADGAYGGVTPRLGIFVTFYSERVPIPRTIIHSIKSDGTMGDELVSERVSRDAIVREAEVGVALDVEVAKSLVTWLQDKISAVESIRATAEQKSGTEQEQTRK